MQWKLFAISFLFLVPSSLLNAQDNPEVARLQGAWEVNSLIENGDVISLKSVRETMIRDGVLVIEGNLMRFTNPVNNKKRELAFVLNPDQNPRTIDLTSTDKIGSKAFTCSTPIIYCSAFAPTIPTNDLPSSLLHRFLNPCSLACANSLATPPLLPPL